jgi:hypothetical protein
MLEIDLFSVAISQIYDCALDPALWPDALRLCCSYVGGVASVLVVHDTRHKSAQLFRTWNDDPQYTKLYVETYARLNPVLVPLTIVQEGEIFAISTLVPPEEFLASRFYKEWAQPQG